MVLNRHEVITGHSEREKHHFVQASKAGQMFTDKSAYAHPSEDLMNCALVLHHLAA